MYTCMFTLAQWFKGGSSWSNDGCACDLVKRLRLAWLAADFVCCCLAVSWQAHKLTVNIFLFSWLVGSHNHFTRRWTIESAPKNALSLEGSGGSVQFLLAIHVFFVFGTSLCYHNSSFLFQSGVPNYLLKRAAARVLEKNRIGESQIIWKNHLRVQMVGFFIARHLCQISIKRWDSFGGRQGRLPGVYPGYLGISTRGSFPFAFAVRLMLPWEVISMRLREVGGLWILWFAVTTFFFLVVGWCL